MEWRLNGATRVVLLTKNWAFKFPGSWQYHPRIWWKHLLLGLLANMQEKQFSDCVEFKDKLCPVKYYIPGGFLVVMPRVRIMTVEEYLEFDTHKFINEDEYVLPVEDKFDTFGYLDGRVVAVDYGS